MTPPPKEAVEPDRHSALWSPGSQTRPGRRRPRGPTPVLPRKEVIQPHLPVRLPCYDFTPLTLYTFGASLHKGWASDFGPSQLSWLDGRCVQGSGTHSPQYADLRLLAIPTSCRRVAACNPNWGGLSRFAPPCGLASLCIRHCSTCAALGIKAMRT